MEDGYIPKMYFSTFICVRYMMKDILLKGINPLQLNSSFTHPMKNIDNLSKFFHSVHKDTIIAIQNFVAFLIKVSMEIRMTNFWIMINV